MTVIIETERLILRTWQKKDLEVYYKINQDPKVIEFLLGPLSMEQVNEFFFRVNNHQDKHGYSLWAVELKDTGEFIGFIGLSVPKFEAHFTPTTEIGWRLDSKHWGKGLATEGARAVLDYGFKILNLPEIVSFTALANIKSIRVMQKIGLKHDKNGNFDHPMVEDNNPLKPHVLYRLKREEYLQGVKS